MTGTIMRMVRIEGGGLLGPVVVAVVAELRKDAEGLLGPEVGVVYTIGMLESMVRALLRGQVVHVASGITPF